MAVLTATSVTVSANPTQTGSGAVNNDEKQLPTDEFSSVLAGISGALPGAGSDNPDALTEQLDGESLPQEGEGLPLVEPTADLLLSSETLTTVDDKPVVPVNAALSSVEEPARHDTADALPLVALANAVNPDIKAAGTEAVLNQAESARPESSIVRAQWLEQLLRPGQAPVTQPAGQTVAADSADTDSLIARMPALQPVPELVTANVRPMDISRLTNAMHRLVAARPVSDTPTGSDLVGAGIATQQHSTTATSAADTSALTLNTPLQKAGWGQELGEKIQWLVGQRIQNAEIRLNPAQLGPMEVKIQIQNDQANIHFTAAHSVVRDALEAALPRLREMFDQNGVQLANVNVSDHSSSQQQQHHQDNGVLADSRTQPSNVPEKLDETGEASVASWSSPLNAVGQLDIFA